MEKVNNEKNQDASGASSENLTSADLTAGYNAIFNPSVSNSSCELSLNSRDKAEYTRCKRNKIKKRTRKLTNADLKEISEDMLEESRQRIDSSIPCKFNQLVYMDNVKGKTYSFRYLKLTSLIGE